jgi:molybdate transport system ATP-binding protein
MAGAGVSDPAPASYLDAELGVRVGAFTLDADLRVGAGEVVAVLGPNGSGKTTMLRLLSGLQALDAGHIRLDGDVLDAPASGRFRVPERRAVSVVFQDYLLFPHLSALDNIAFGVRAQGASKGEARRVAAMWLDRFELGAQPAAKPRALSGGQAQRVALARALATSPRLLLLDEPLAALDAGTRTTVRRDLRRHLDDFGGATLLVTHDPLDAIALAARVIILEDGRVVQQGSIQDITERPTSRYVADLIGLNLLHGTARGTTAALDGSSATVTLADPMEGRVNVLIHPNAVALHTSHPGGSPRNQWSGRIAGFDLLGDRVRVRVHGDVNLVAEVTPAAVAALELHEGQEVWTAVKATEITAYPS